MSTQINERKLKACKFVINVANGFEFTISITILNKFQCWNNSVKGRNPS